jgi:tRNA(Arg) A34 adenosine deaminase TadA
MTREQMLDHLRAANDVAREAAAHGHHPFGSVLVGPDGAILMRQGNIDTVHHAEAEIARRAAAAYEPEFLWTTTMVTTFEPCAMCTGTLYWANIGGLVYGAAESRLLVLLCHKLACWQHGHRNSLLAKSLANLTRMVAIDEATWRSGLIGGSAGSITWG